jgi:sortase (surface protein transpeptidase)
VNERKPPENFKKRKKQDPAGLVAAGMLAAGFLLFCVPTARRLVQAKVQDKESAPIEDAAEEMEQRPGMVGRLVIPDCGIDVAVFSVTGDDTAGTRQRIVNRKDSALYLPATENTREIIADHAVQGFSGMEQAVPGSTLLYLNGNGTTKVYRCTACAVGTGTNTGSDLLDANGTSLLAGQDGKLVLYTCHGLWQTVSYTIWEPLETVPNG